MVGYMSLEEQVDADFSLARRRAFLRRISARLRKDPTSNRLLCFGEVRRKVGAAGGVRRGRRTVRLADIVGSVSRCSEFDGAFLPLRESARTKWERMDRALHRGEELPPVELYRIGETYFVNDGNHRVSVARYHGIEWIDAEVTELRIPSPLEPTRTGTVDEPKGNTLRDELPKREDPKMHAIVDPRGGIEVRWGLEEDEARIAKLTELNGMRRVLAFEERFIVAERDGKILAVLRYRTEPRRLLLGLLISDPWTEERPLAVALYARAGELAREMGVGEVRARPVLHADDYPYEAGYRWRFPGGWYLDTTRLLHRRKELPAGGWQRLVFLLGIPALPFFSALRGAGRWTYR